jgi:TetR/AcrR family transcriptional regulator, tetracycline repressor protein
MPGAPEPPWRRRHEEPSRAERRPLTRDAIVDAALRVLDREGMAGLSMRKLAQELDVGAASLYWHVRDKEELLGLLLDRIVGEAQLPDPDPENWREVLKETARENRRLLQRHRDAAQISLGRIPVGPHSMPVMERNLAILRASGLPARVIALAADMFALYVGGYAFEESMGSPQTDTKQLAEYFRSLPADEFPTLVELADELTEGGADERFEFALELLVRGLEAMGKDD